MRIGLEDATNEIGLDHETLWLMEPDGEKPVVQPDFFPAPQTELHSIVSQIRSQKGRNAALTKAPGGNDNFYPEGRPSYTPSFKLGRGKSALANLPADTDSFPVSSWFRDLLEKGVQTFVLNSQVIKQPSPPGLRQRFQTDGSNLPWVIAELRKNEKRFHAWLAHVQTALSHSRLSHFRKHRLENAQPVIGNIILGDFKGAFKFAVLDCEAIGRQILDLAWPKPFAHCRE